MAEEKGLQFDDLADVSGGVAVLISRTVNPDGSITCVYKDDGNKRKWPGGEHCGKSGPSGDGICREGCRRRRQKNGNNPMHSVFELFHQMDGTGKEWEVTFRVRN
ncbi:MAG: hypothetical protein LBJ95_03705 [Oscillospiraceae bacterium]|nr:hypothetical protein [Oscillospiraceae bacterium]